METIPAINCLDLDCVEQRLEQAAAFLPRGGWVHLDVSDGRFTFNKTWSDPLSWPRVAAKYSFNLEVHLMCETPELVADSWLRAGAQRLIVQAEMLDQASFKKVLEVTERYGVETMVSLSPETPTEEIRPYFEDSMQFQVLAVSPGLAGQKFLPVALEKVKFLRALKPGARIEVDGGINPETAKAAKEAGADAVAAASYIFWGSDPKGAYEELVQI